MADLKISEELMKDAEVSATFAARNSIGAKGINIPEFGFLEALAVYQRAYTDFILKHATEVTERFNPSKDSPQTQAQMAQIFATKGTPEQQSQALDWMHGKDFSQEPMTVSELRGLKDGVSSSWSPRDVLVRMLRHIDGGSKDVHRLIICYSHSFDETDNSEMIGYSASGVGPLSNVGLIEWVKNQIIRDGKD